MYNDDFDWNVYFNCLKVMYVNYFVRIDIVGIVDSIYKIIKEELYKCYNIFYNLGNMVLFVVGDLDVEKVIDVIKKLNNYKVDRFFKSIERFYLEELEGVKEKEVIEKFFIFMFMFNIGFKDSNVGLKGKEFLCKEIVIDIFVGMLFKKGSKFYEDLYM